MIDLIILGVYVLGFIVCLRNVSRRLAWEDVPRYGSKPDTDDYVMGLAIGAMASLIWPITLPIAWMTEHPAIFDRVLGTPRRVEELHQKERIKELEAKIRQLDYEKERLGV